ncbi:hypothetical protein N431DRAFT_7395 [Stipitochalara longipes BDJ]|nr:hypothetical protein N431DRAFT_7395 [Stipitochalara longipes BDJ]
MLHPANRPQMAVGVLCRCDSATSGGPCFLVGCDGLIEMLASSKWRAVRQSKFVGKIVLLELLSNLESVELAGAVLKRGLRLEKIEGKQCAKSTGGEAFGMPGRSNRENQLHGGRFWQGSPSVLRGDRAGWKWESTTDWILAALDLARRRELLIRFKSTAVLTLGSLLLRVSVVAMTKRYHAVARWWTSSCVLFFCTRAKPGKGGGLLARFILRT